MRAVLISIQPKWVEKIASGAKMIEVRKTKPKLETPFKVYIYATKPKKWVRVSSILYASDESLWLVNGKVKMCDGLEFWADCVGHEPLCGKVIGEFICDKIIDIKPFALDIEEFEKQSCLSALEIARYLKGLYGYGWHISDLVIYDKPILLEELGLDNAPQSWRYV